MEGAQIDDGTSSGSQESKQDEEEKSWSGAYELGSHDKLGSLQEMVGILQGLEKLCASCRGRL